MAYDFRVHDHGSIMAVVPLTEQADDWVEDNVQLEGWQWFGGGFAVEPRYLNDLIFGMEDDGLTVQA